MIFRSNSAICQAAEFSVSVSRQKVLITSREDNFYYAGERLKCFGQFGFNLKKIIKKIKAFISVFLTSRIKTKSISSLKKSLE